MDKPDIHSYAIFRPNETIQVHYDGRWSFTFPTPEDAVALALPPPLLLQAYHEHHLLEVKMMDGSWSVTLVIYGVRTPRTMKLDSSGYSHLVSIVMDSYREIVPMRKI